MSEIEVLRPLILTTARILRAHLRDVYASPMAADLTNMVEDIADMEDELMPFQPLDVETVNEEDPPSPADPDPE